MKLSRQRAKTPNIDQVQVLTQMLLKMDAKNIKRPIRIKRAESEHSQINCPIQNGAKDQKIVVLKNKELKSLNGIEQYKFLNYLDVANNQIKDIQLSNLEIKVLIISGNRLTLLQDLPQTLTIVDASMNNLSYVKLSNLNNLRILHLQKNQITSFSFQGLLKIQKLYLDENKISQLTDIPVLPKLQILSATNNYITQISESQILQNLQKLQEFYLLNNPITKFNIQENYLDYLRDTKPRCKSVQNNNRGLKIETKEILQIEKSIPKLHVQDFNNITPLPQKQSRGQSIYISRIMQRQNTQNDQQYRTETSKKSINFSQINPFSIKSIKINFQFDPQFIQKVQKSTKYHFDAKQIQKIKSIKSKFKQSQLIEECVYKFFPDNKCIMCYGNPQDIEEYDVQSVVICYFNISQFKQTTLTVFNKITQITLRNNSIEYLSDLNKLRPIFAHAIDIIIEKNSISNSSLWKQYVKRLYNTERGPFDNFFNLDRSFPSYMDIETPKISGCKIGNLFEQYIEQLITQFE
ncbi:Protein nud1 [Paramecium bursaria]